MNGLQSTDILTRITRYNLIRNQRLVHIDVHEALHGRLAGRFVAVPNVLNLIAKQEYQGVGETESEALQACLAKIQGAQIEDLFPHRTETDRPSTD